MENIRPFVIDGHKTFIDHQGCCHEEYLGESCLERPFNNVTYCQTRYINGEPFHLADAYQEDTPRNRLEFTQMADKAFDRARAAPFN